MQLNVEKPWRAHKLWTPSKFQQCRSPRTLSHSTSNHNYAQDISKIKVRVRDDPRKPDAKPAYQSRDAADRRNTNGGGPPMKSGAAMRNVRQGAKDREYKSVVVPGTG